MPEGPYLSISELAAILGISRIAVYKRVKKGRIKAIRIGRSFAIPKQGLADALGATLGRKAKKEMGKAVKKTVDEYDKVLKLLGGRK
ncbi:helix-turn-helix domain-containing protein [Candidatus Omnitrophota bacterium]